MSQDPARRFKNDFTWIKHHELRKGAVQFSVTMNLEAMSNTCVEQQYKL
jgi:hypothetical protein